MIDGNAIVPDSKEMLCFHPHGALCCGWTIAQASKQLCSLKTNIHWLVASALFKIPFIGDWLSWCQCGPVDSSNMKKLMVQDKNIAILPGGFNSAALFKRNHHRCYVRKRKGFVKYALQYGYTLRPCYTFGEELTYRTFNFFEGFRMKLADRNIPPVLFIGNIFAPLMPLNNINLVTVCGEPLVLPHIINPSKQDIDEWHGKYVSSLQDLFDKHKATYAATGVNAQLQLL